MSRPTLWVEVSTLLALRGNATGIGRTLSQLVRHLLADPRCSLRLCRYDLIDRVHFEVDPASLPSEPGPDASPHKGEGSGWLRAVTRRLPGNFRRGCRFFGLGLVHFGLMFRRVGVIGYRSYRRLKRRIWPAPAICFTPGDVLFNAGAGWEECPDPAGLRELRGRGVRVANLIYDVTALRCPHLWEPNFADMLSEWVERGLEHSDLVVTISRHARADLLGYARQHGLREASIEVIRLGDEPGTNVEERRPADLPAGPFVLFVSTIAAHKNHRTLLHVWRRLLDHHGDRIPTLVLAGGDGWQHELTLRELAADPALTGRVVRLRVGDAELRWLYRHCQFTMYPSHYEGWGLPVAESLVHGKYCVCSHAASLPEVGGDLVDYHDPLDVPGCLKLVEKALFEPGWLAQREQRIHRDYRTTSWLDCERQVFDLLDRHFGLTTRSRDEAA